MHMAIQKLKKITIEFVKKLRLKLRARLKLMLILSIYYLIKLLLLFW